MTADRPLGVLIVDDEPLVRDLLRHRLTADGFAVLDEAGDAKSGVALAMVHLPDIVILDVMMPGLNGLEVVEMFRDIVPSCVIVIYTALDSPSVEAAARSKGATAVVDKADGHARLLATLALVVASAGGA
jgi:DNA-binding NarL/FixJ family response regulator